MPKLSVSCCFNSLQVKSDAVGFGFVVRGSSPVYIQTIDPKGPAAAAGLKVQEIGRAHV